jgi:undecaprenyl pyrophosphate synthase
MESVTDKQKKNSERRAGGVANLKPFKKGQSGNPAGRPKSLTLSEAYRRELAKIDETDPQKRTFAEVLAEQTIIKAKTGDVAALRELADRTEGKARQTIMLTTDRREQIEQAVTRMIERAAVDGQKLSREEATTALAAYVPEASQLIH